MEVEFMTADTPLPPCKVDPALWALEGLAAALLPVIREFYTREENVQAFEAWLKDRESDPQKHSKRK